MDCDFKPYENGFRCVSCETFKRQATRRNCDASNAMGEKIASISKAIGIKPCGGCQKRREALNRMSVRLRNKRKK